MKYKKLALGGTFDRLHRGYEKILETAFSLAEYVYIGLVSSEELLKNKELREKIEPYETREKNLRTYLQSYGCQKEHVYFLCTIDME